MKLRLVGFEEHETGSRTIKDIREITFDQKTADGRRRAIGRWIDEMLTMDCEHIVVDVVKKTPKDAPPKEVDEDRLGHGLERETEG